jgi:hypothetical protein
MTNDDSILDYTRNVLVHDSIYDIFESYATSYGLIENGNISEEQIEHMVEEFQKMYHDYIEETFKELDIQIVEINDEEYIQIDELMLKVAGIAAAKLAAEILIIEVLNSTVYSE